MMENILPIDDALAKCATEELVALLSGAKPFLRCKIFPVLAARIKQDSSLESLIFNKVERKENIEQPFFGFIKVAWVAAIALLENEGDQERLRKTIQENWPIIEQQDFLSYIGGYKNFSSNWN